MGLFRKIFPRGKTTPAEESGLEKSLSEIDTQSDPIIYPILKEYNWVAKPFAVYKHYMDSDKPPVPLIGFGYDTTDNFIFLTQDKLGERSIDDLYAESLSNLQKEEAEWENFTDFMLTASGKTFSSEKILDPEFLKDAQTRLDTDEILVAVPRRTVIYAARADLAEQQMAKFKHIVAYTLKDDSFGNAFITNLLFKFKEGVFSGALIVELPE